MLVGGPSSPLGHRKQALHRSRGRLIPPSGARADTSWAAGGRVAQFNKETPHLKVVTEQPEFAKQVVDAKALTTIL